MSNCAISLFLLITARCNAEAPAQAGPGGINHRLGSVPASIFCRTACTFPCATASRSEIVGNTGVGEGTRVGLAIGAGVGVTGIAVGIGVCGFDVGIGVAV